MLIFSLSKMSRFMTFFLIWKVLALAPGSSSVLERDYYAEGLEFLKAGDWEGALKVWWEGWTALEGRGETDPRIGVGFIELATEKGAERYYGTACEMYMWGFSREPESEFKDVVIEEAERIIPLMDEGQQKEWKKLVRSRDPVLCRRIRLFWIEKDSRPATKGNERLIEHWERIAYARKHFRMTKSGVYDCDDRGTIYVKYGMPDKKKSGSFGSSSESQIELMLRIDSIIDDSNEARRLIRSQDPCPEYEIWAYGNISTDQTSLFLFSNREGVGHFGLQPGIESVILSKDYIYNSPSELSYVPRDYLIYQIMYYAELRSFDDFFEERYDQIDQIWEAATRELRRWRQRALTLPREYLNLLRNIAYTNKTTDKLNPTYKHADVDKSDYEDLTGKIKLLAYPVRLLDRRNRTRLALLAVSSPQFKVEDMVRTSDDALVFPEYKLNHTLIVRDASLDEVDRRSRLIPGGLSNLSSFLLDHERKDVHYTLGAEAFVDTAEFDEVSARVLAMGKSSFRVPPPLDDNLETLELSDLILGIDAPADTGISDYPFPVIPANEFAKQDPVKMYIEIYHLLLDERAEAGYTIEYGVTRVEKKGKKKKEQISMAYSFRVPSRTGREALSVDISELRPGQYEFFVKVKDALSRQEKTRRGMFTVEK